MRTNYWSKLAVLACSVVFLSACSSMKNKQNTDGLGPDGAQTQGLDNPDDLQGPNSAYRLKAPYNQVYYFDFDKDAIQHDDIPSIYVQAAYLVAHPNARVRVEGNTDARGSREYNVALGWRRAKAVASLLKQQGVIEKQIVMLSYGKEKPIAFGQDEESYKLNRRANFIYETK
ncbi:MAG: hypothetical protein A2X78_02315 [Gammaproteobacteria bacterium GWE2_37_16]|nr:MAG: hypothetical protein A2X78_02315 [Gammaproteobacteria bacterium GWE2_37_16]